MVIHKSGCSRLRELFITEFKCQVKRGFTMLVVTRANRLPEWSQGELWLYRDLFVHEAFDNMVCHISNSWMFATGSYCRCLHSEISHLGNAGSGEKSGAKSIALWENLNSNVKQIEIRCVMFENYG